MASDIQLDTVTGLSGLLVRRNMRRMESSLRIEAHALVRDYEQSTRARRLRARRKKRLQPLWAAMSSKGVSVLSRRRAARAERLLLLSETLFVFLSLSSDARALATLSQAPEAMARYCETVAKEHGKALAEAALDLLRRWLDPQIGRWLCDPPPLAEIDPTARPWFEVDLFALLRSLGPNGGALVDRWEADAALDITEEQDEMPRWLRALVAVLWDDQLEAEIELKNELALRQAGGIGVLTLARRDAQGVAALRAHRIERGALATDGEAILVPRVSIELLEASSLALKQLGAALAPRLLEWQAQEWLEKWHRSDPDANVQIPGGWAGLAERMGLSSDRARKELETLCSALTSVTWAWECAGSSGRYPLLAGYKLLGAARSRANGPKGAVLTITLSELFRPPIARGIRDQRLVPVVALPDARRCEVSPRMYALVESLHRRGVLALVDGADQLRRFGAVCIDWPGLADDLLRPHVPALLASEGWRERWEKRGDRWVLRRSPETERAIEHLGAFKGKGRKRR